jgi:glycosyltransferase involved in cell wall biosynthesis
MRILYLATISNTINTFLIPHISFLVKKGYKVDIACQISKELKPELTSIINNIYNIPFSRKPFSKSNFKSYFILKKLLHENTYDIIHTHTPIVSAIVRLINGNNSATKIFYTAHGFHFHRTSGLLSWLIHYPVEKYLSKFTHTLITINTEDYRLAIRNFDAKHTFYVPGVGIDINKFNGLQNGNTFKSEMKLDNQSTKIIVSIGELNKNKNHITIIKSLEKIGNYDFLYVISGEGPYKKYLLNYISKSHIKEKVILTGYRNDIPHILNSASLFIIPSYREGLSVALMEAMVKKLPVISSDIRGNRDLVIHGKGGFLIQNQNLKSYSSYIKLLLEDQNLATQFGVFNFSNIQKYTLNRIIDSLEVIYGI